MKLLIAIPAYNEEKIIQKNITTLYDFCKNRMAQYDWSIIVADNNSTDSTQLIVTNLSRKLPKIIYTLVPKKGKGIAVRSAWLGSEADIYCFMDADLAVDLEALPRLIAAIADEHYDIACGSRYHKESRVKRTLLRKIISLGYRAILKIIFHLRVKDVPCGFKAINRKVWREILQKIQSNEWFFDSELIIMAEHCGFKIKEIPVSWEEKNEKGRKSRVNIFSLSIEYIKKVLELKLRLRKNI